MPPRKGSWPTLAAEGGARASRAAAVALAVAVVTGRYDLLVEVYVEPYNIMKFLSTELAKIDSIVAVESFIALHCVNKFV